MSTLEAASASLQPSSEREKEEKCEHTTSTPLPERGVAGRFNEIAAEKRVGLEKEDATLRAESSFDETDHSIPARQSAVLQRVLSQWQKRKRREEFTPKSEAYRTSLQPHPIVSYTECTVYFNGRLRSLKIYMPALVYGSPRRSITHHTSVLSGS